MHYNQKHNELLKKLNHVVNFFKKQVEDQKAISEKCRIDLLVGFYNLSFFCSDETDFVSICRLLGLEWKNKQKFLDDLDAFTIREKSRKLRIPEAGDILIAFRLMLSERNLRFIPENKVESILEYTFIALEIELDKLKKDEKLGSLIFLKRDPVNLGAGLL